MVAPGRLRVVALSPSTRPNEVLSNGGPVYTSSSTLMFTQLKQASKLYNMSLSGEWGVYDSATQKWLDVASYGLSPNVGAYGLFSSYTLKRHAQVGVVDSVLTHGLRAHTISTSKHSPGSILDSSGGNSIFPGLLDTSNAQNLSARSSFTPSGNPAPNTSFIMHDFHITPLSGMLNNQEPVNLLTLGGFDLFFTIGQLNDAVVAMYGSAGTKAGTTFIMPSSAHPFANPNSLGVNAPYASTQLKLCVRNPILWLVFTTDPSLEDTPQSFSFPTVNYTPIPAQPSLQFKQALLLAPVQLQTLEWVVTSNKRPQLNQFSPFDTLSMITKSADLVANNRRQFYAFLTALNSFVINSSPVTPDQMTLTPILTNQPAGYLRSYLGASIKYNFDEDGNGIALSDTVMSFDWTSSPYTLSGFPWNSVLGTERFTFGFPMFRQYNLSQINSAEYTNRLNYTPNNQYPQSAIPMCPAAKYYQFDTPTTDLNVSCIQTSTNTVLLNNTSNLVIPAKKSTVRLPKATRYNHAAGVSSVQRVVRNRIPSQFVLDAIPNTIAYETLMPDAGAQGVLIAEFLPIYPCTYYTAWRSCVVSNLAWLVISPPEYAGLGNSTLSILNIVYGGNGGFTYPVVLPTKNTSAGFNYTVAVNWANTTPYMRGRTILGEASLIRQFAWRLPGGLLCQRQNVATATYLKSFGNGFPPAMERHDHKISFKGAGYYLDPSNDSQLIDLVPSRAMGTMFSTAMSYAAFSGPTQQLSDFPSEAPFIVQMDLNTLDEMIYKFQGLPFNTSQRRLLTLYFDTRPGAMADLGSLSSCPSLYTTLVDLDTAKLTKPFYSSAYVNLPQPVIYSTTAATTSMVVHQVFHSPETMRQLQAQFALNGTELQVTDYYIQRRFLELNQDFSVKMDTMTIPTDISIGGYDVKQAFIMHSIATESSGDVNTYDERVPNAFYQLLPPDIARRHGMSGYSLPGGINKSGNENERLRSDKAMTYDLTLDEVSVNGSSYRFGLPVVNRIQYACIFGETQNILAQDTDIHAPLRTSFTWPRISCLRPGTDLTGAKPGWNSIPHGRQRLPKHHVVSINITDDFSNAALARFTSYGDAFFTYSGTSRATARSGNIANYLTQPLFLMREYCFEVPAVVRFNTNASSLHYEYPAQSSA